MERFLNKISGSLDAEQPPPFSGGIIADPMGLGKTLTVIAMAASDLDHARGQASNIHGPGVNGHSTAATLIVVPPPCESLIDSS